MDASQTGTNATGMVRGMARWEIRDRAQLARRAIVAAAADCREQLTPASGLSSRLSLSHERNTPAAAESRGDNALDSLRWAVEEYVHILAALGHDGTSAGELAEHAAREGVGEPVPDQLLAAMRLWATGAADQAVARR